MSLTPINLPPTEVVIFDILDLKIRSTHCRSSLIVIYTIRHVFCKYTNMRRYKTGISKIEHAYLFIHKCTQYSLMMLSRTFQIKRLGNFDTLI